MFRLFNAYSSYLSRGDYLNFLHDLPYEEQQVIVGYLSEDRNQINIQLSKRILAGYRIIHVARFHAQAEDRTREINDYLDDKHKVHRNDVLWAGPDNLHKIRGLDRKKYIALVSLTIYTEERWRNLLEDVRTHIRYVVYDEPHTLIR